MNITEQLRQHAIAAHAAYPQYVGYYDGWTLGQTTKRIRTKGGTDIARGTFVLTNFDHEAIPGLDGDVAVVSIYDPATTHNVAVETAYVAPVQQDSFYRHALGLVTLIG